MPAAGKSIVGLIEISFLVGRIKNRIPAYLEKGAWIKENKLIERGRFRRRHRVGVGVDVQVLQIGGSIVAPADDGVDKRGLLSSR